MVFMAVINQLIAGGPHSSQHLIIFLEFTISPVGFHFVHLDFLACHMGCATSEHKLRGFTIRETVVKRRAKFRRAARNHGKDAMGGTWFHRGENTMSSPRDFEISWDFKPLEPSCSLQKGVTCRQQKWVTYSLLTVISTNFEPYF